MSDVRLVSDGLSVREARLAFWRSRMCVIDEIKSRTKFMTMTWISFLEALGRLADYMSIPIDDDLHSIGADDIMGYHKKLAESDAETQARLRKRRPSADFKNSPTRPLVEKFDRLIRIILGRMAVIHKGAIQQGGKRMSLVGSYITQKQLRAL